VQPRFGFNYDASETLFGDRDRIVSAEIRGGYGKFMGRIPRVWYGNAYSRSGVLSDYVKVYGHDSTLPSFRCGGTVGPMPAGDPSFFWMGASSNYCIPSSPYFNDAQVTDPDFEAPQSWRGNLALDLVTAGGYKLTLEYNHDSVDQAVFYKEVGLTRESIMADGRGVYSHGPGDFMLTNTGEGGAKATSFSVQKSFDNGLSMFGSWASVSAEDVYPLTSAQAESAYGYTQRWDGENVPAARSSFMADSKLVVGLEYRTMLFGDNETRVSAIYINNDIRIIDTYVYDEGQSKGQFTLTEALAGVASGAFTVQPRLAVYGDGTGASVATDVMNHINSGPLAKYKGTYAPRNAFDNPGYDRLDVRITQEIPSFMEGHNFLFYLDLLNVMNMLDDEQGRIFEYGYNTSRQIIADAMDDGRFEIKGIDPDDSLYLQDNDGQSRWQIQMGLKYKF
jgi:hypothetical protein